MRNLLLGTQKCVFEDVAYDSKGEKVFAQALEDDLAVKVYTKLPGWFQVATPLGTYNPDWALVIEEPDGDRLYFVVETKASLMPGDLRAKEEGKIDCARAHFAALAEGEELPARFNTARTVHDLLAGA